MSKINFISLKFWIGGGKIKIKYVLPVLLIFGLALFINAEDVAAADTAATTVSPKVTYTPTEINTAATKVKNFVETNKRLPNYVNMKNKQVKMPQFLLLLSYDVTQTNSGSKSSVVLKNVKTPTKPTETVKTGSLTKTEYIKLANTLKSSINTKGKVPNYVSSTKGNIRYESLVYSYSKTMNYYAKNKKLPSTVSIAPWTKTEGTTTKTTTTTTQAASGTSFTINQIVTASNNVKSYVEQNGKIPSTVTVNGKKINTPQFLQLLSYTIAQLNSGSKASITLKSVTSPTKPTETVKDGTLLKAEYVKLAQTVKTATSKGKAPDYADSTLGKIRYETLVYIFSKTVSFYGANNRLPNTLSVTPYSNLDITVPGNVQAIVDKIGKDEAKYKNIQGDWYSYLNNFLSAGGGNCWGSSLYLYTRLTAEGISARIMGYVGGISNNAFKHAWVQLNTGSGWKNWDYKKYSSKHNGELGGGTKIVLIGPGVKGTPDLVKAYYAVL